MTRPLSDSISDFALPWRSLEWPPVWEEVFGRRAPLVLEIGFGNGAFMEDLVHANPECDHLGVEISWTSATYLFRRLERIGATNVRVVLADAHVVVSQLLAPGSISRVFINHPCPWPKARHHARRLIAPDFLRILGDRLAPEAIVTIVTDHADYAEWITAALEGQHLLQSCHTTTEVAAINERVPTKYERKALAQGIDIHYFEWRKVSESTGPGSLPASDPLAPMPNLTLRGTHDANQLLADFEPITRRESHEGIDVVVRLRGAYRQTNGRSWLIEALVKEDRLQQDFALLVATERSGELLVKLSGLGGRPHPTFGVKYAIWEVGRWLLEHHPGLELVHENLGEAVTGER